MRKTIAGTVIALALMAGLVHAKGPTVKLTVAGPGLAQALEVTDPNALVHVWNGDFIGLATSVPDESLPRYTVSFYALPPRSAITMVYVVLYARDSKTGQGFVYLPGRGEEWYGLNVSTILRDGQDGKWHKASPAWSTAVSAALP
jgi:hypothetical protein